MTNQPPVLSPPSSGLGDLEFRDYLEIVRRRKVPLFLCALGFFSFSIVFASRLPNFYRSETLIMVDPQQVPSSYVQSTVSTSIEDRLSTIQEQVMSATHLQHIIDKLGLYSDLRGKRSEQQIIAAMRKATTVEVVGPTGRLSSFRIAFQSKDPQTASKVPNELASEFISENLRVRLQQFDGAADFLDSEMHETKSQLEAKEQELQRIRVQNAADLPESRQYHLEALNNLRGQLRTSQELINRAEEQEATLQQYAPTIDLDLGGYGPSVSPFQSRIQKLERQLTELRARYGPGHPDVRKAESELADLRAQEAAEQKQQESTAVPKAAPVLNAAHVKNPVLQAQEEKLGQEIREQKALQKQYQDQINLHTAKLEQGPVFEQRIGSLMRDYDSLRGHYQDLLNKKLSAEMAKELEGRQQGERFVVLDSAPVPQSPAGPNRLLISAAGLVVGTLAGVALILAMEFSDESVRNEREAASLIGKAVLAGVPRIYGLGEQRKMRLKLTGVFVGTVASGIILGYMLSMLGIGS